MPETTVTVEEGGALKDTDLTVEKLVPEIAPAVPAGPDVGEGALIVKLAV